MMMLKNQVLRKLTVLTLMLAMVLAAAAPALAQGAAGTVSGDQSANQPEPSDKATLSFELTVEGEPPAGATFLGFTTLESLMTTPLTDPDGDGTYTGSMTVPKFAPGGPPEPISLSTVRIVQGPPTGTTANGPEYRVIKDFGSVKLDGDKTFSASVSFDDEEPALEEVSATGRIVEIADYPGASHAIMDEASGARYLLTSDSVDLQDYAVSEERVIVYGTPVPNQGITDTLLNVTRVEPADEGENPNPSDKATLSFELTVEGEPPAEAEFLGFTSIESLMTTPLSDPDGDGTYTGSMSVPATSGGQGGPPEPLSLPVRIVQGPPTEFSGVGPEYRVIKDFGQVKIDEDKTFSASVSFPDDNGGSDDGDGSEVNVKGTITSISGSTVLVEETPAAEGSGDKGFFTVTDETEITKQQEGKQVEAAFEDLEVGQIVEATYAGAFAQSYPTQGNAQSIAIIEELTCMLPEGCDDPGDEEEKVTATFELTTECQPPAGTGFSASIGQGPVATGALLDQDGDGVYTVSLPVEQGTEQEVLIERLDPINDEPQAPLTASTLKDFGSVKFDEDETLSASVSFCDDGSDDGGTDNGDGSDNNDGSDNASGSGGSGSGSSGGASDGGIVTSGLRNFLPSTGGGMALTLLGVGVLMTGGGLIIRRIFR